MQPLVFLGQGLFPGGGDEIAPLAALSFRFHDPARSLKAVQQVVEGAGAYRHPALGEIGDAGHHVGAAAFLPEGQQHIEHLLRQCLKFLPGHSPASLLSIFDISVYSILSNIDIVKRK